MKILTVNTYFSPVGGAETIAYNTYKMLKRYGHKSYFFAIKEESYFENGYRYKKFFPYANISIKSYLKNPIKFYHNYEAAKNFELMIQEIKPDIVHFHNLYLLTNSLISVCKKYNIPMVRTLHDVAIVCPVVSLMKKKKNYCRPISCRNGNFLPCIFNNCDKKGFESSLRHAISNYLGYKGGYISKINQFITPSKALKDLLLEAEIGIPDKKISVIKNFMDDSTSSNVKPNYTNKKYFLFCGRLSEDKGPNIILQAAAQLPKEIGFHIVGTGEMQNELANIVKSMNLKNVKLCGFLKGTKLRNEYQNCIALIAPSKVFETFALTVMEAFMHGKPVIASNLGGIADLVEHGKTGFLITPQNTDELIQYILRLWNNQNQAVAMGKAAYKKSITQFTEATYYKSLISVYQSVIKDKV